MPLFVCSKCGYIEDTTLVNKPKYGMLVNNKEQKELIREQSAIIEDAKSNGYPCLSLKEMLAQDTKNMLCCECNTGLHHNSFVKLKADETSLAIAETSPTNMITFVDQKVPLIKDTSTQSGYNLPHEYWDYIKANPNKPRPINGKWEKIKTSNESYTYKYTYITKSKSKNKKQKMLKKNGINKIKFYNNIFSMLNLNNKDK